MRKEEVTSIPPGKEELKAEENILQKSDKKCYGEIKNNPAIYREHHDLNNKLRKKATQCEKLIEK